MPDAGLRVTPEQLIALNDEIAMLVRAGVPLELGLTQISHNVPSALAKISRELSLRMAAGEPLGASFSATLPGMPRVYSAVIDAGLQSGNLPKALESLSRFAQQGIELRHRIEFAFIYPLLVFSIAYTLFLTFTINTAERWNGMWGQFVSLDDPFVETLAFFSHNWKFWAWIPPAVVGGMVLWWVTSARYSFLPDRQPSPLLGLIPGLRSILKYWHWANFCDLLATLLEHQVPLPAALALAADATGNTVIHTQMSAVAADLADGRSMSDSLRPRTAIPAYLRWSLGAAHDPQALQSVLWHGQELYRGRATFRADVIKMWLPMILVVALGGGAALIYALTMALPLRSLFMQLELDGMR